MRRARKLTPEERKLRRAEQMLHQSSVRARRSAATVAYWQAKVQLLNADYLARVQPSLFGAAQPDLPNPVLTEQHGREKTCSTKQPPFEKEQSSWLTDPP